MSPLEFGVWFLGGGTVLQCVLAYLLKSLTSHLLAKDIESYKTKLAAESNIAAEQLKNTFAITAFEHQVRFSKLHEKRADVLAELYKRLEEAYSAAHRYTVQLAGDGGKNESYIDVEKAIRAFYDFLQINRIYLPQYLCDLLQDFSQSLRQPIAEVWSYSSVLAPNEEIARKRGDALIKAFESFSEGDIQKARRAIEDEFRAMLNAQPSSVAVSSPAVPSNA